MAKRTVKASEAKASPLQQRILNVADLVLVNPQNIQPVYSNNAAVTYGPHDFRITFTEIVTGLTISVTEAPKLELRATVAMSPTEFKALVDVMKGTLEVFERQFGKVTWPPEEKAANLKM